MPLGVVKQQIEVAVKFHDVIHGFSVGWGSGNASLEAKLLQQPTERREEVLYEVLLNLHKAYDNLNRYWCMGIIVGYGIGLRTERILRYYW